MTDQRQTPPMPPDGRSVIDENILSGLFRLGDTAMQRVLLTHLVADFARLGESLMRASPASLGEVAHELKGLSATVGAVRLAEMAEGVCILSETPDPGLAELLVKPLRAEIDLVMVILRQRGQGLDQ